MRRVIVYVHGSKRVGKTVFSNEVVRLAKKDDILAETASVVGTMREWIKKTFGLTDDHVHGDLKETALEQYGDLTARNLMDDFVSWHFKRDPSRMCFLRSCMAEIESRTDVTLTCIQDVIHGHEPAYICQIAKAMDAWPIGIHVYRPDHADTYGVNLPRKHFDFGIDNDGTLQEYLEKVRQFFKESLRPKLYAAVPAR